MYNMLKIHISLERKPPEPHFVIGAQYIPVGPVTKYINFNHGMDK